MQVDVIELIAADGLGNHIRRGVGAKAHVTNPSLALKLATNLHAAALAKRLVQVLAVVDAVDGKQIHVILLQVGHGSLEGLEELLRGRLGHDLRLKDDRLARILRQHRPELHLRGSIAPSRLDVVNTQFHGASDGRLQIGLPRGNHLIPGDIRPGLLVTHAAAGKDRHLDSGPAKTTVLHGLRECLLQCPQANPDLVFPTSLPIQAQSVFRIRGRSST